jgi:hypothetical protein
VAAVVMPAEEATAARFPSSTALERSPSAAHGSISVVSGIFSNGSAALRFENHFHQVRLTIVKTFKPFDAFIERRNGAQHRIDADGVPRQQVQADWVFAG